MNKKTNLRLFFVFILIVIAFFFYYDKISNLPGEFKVIQGEEKIIEFNFPINARIKSDNFGFLINGSILDKDDILVDLSKPISLKFLDEGVTNLEFNIGFLPIKKIKVDVVLEKNVVPGGHSIGVKLRSNGLIVVGYSNITNQNNRRYSPGKKSGILIGDVLMEINNEKILDVDHMTELVNKSKGSDIEIMVNRDSKVLILHVKPIYNKEEKLYQLGLWVRDVAAGVGTLTFYDPNNMIFAALGHIITDIDTGKPIEISDGEIIKAKVTSIEKGEKNKPGEKRGVFVQESEIVGRIITNTTFGIYGKLNQRLKNPFYDTVPIALIEEIEEGAADILTVIRDDKIEKFSIEIVKIFNQNKPDGKGMVIKVTDPRLLNQTGGIIQGMSGSPILQRGKLIGAVTHVFVNTPARGYGVFAEWMINSITEIDKNCEKTVAYN